MNGDWALRPAEGALRAGLGCCTPPLASSNFRFEKASTMLGAAPGCVAVVVWLWCSREEWLAKGNYIAPACGRQADETRDQKKRPKRPSPLRVLHPPKP